VFEQVKIHNTNTGIAKVCDVLSRTDKTIRIVFPGTNIPMTLSRTDVRKRFVGHYAGMEFWV